MMETVVAWQISRSAGLHNSTCAAALGTAAALMKIVLHKCVIRPHNHVVAYLKLYRAPGFRIQVSATVCSDTVGQVSQQR
jgi:hypothetical protein